MCVCVCINVCLYICINIELTQIASRKSSTKVSP